MKVSPKRHAEQMNTLVQVWTALSPTKVFNGITLKEVRGGFQESLEARVRIADAQAELAAAIRARDTADQGSVHLYERTIMAIKADSFVGIGSEMYKAIDSNTRRARRGGAHMAPASSPAATTSTRTEPSIVKPAA